MNKQTKEFTSDICLKCIEKKKKWCCSVYPVPLALKDIKKIESAWYNLIDFISISCFTYDEISDYLWWWKKWLIKIKDKYYKLSMKKKNNWDCIFLNEWKWCVLDKNRPFICKLYPFWIWAWWKVIFDEDEKELCEAYIQCKNINETLSWLWETNDSVKYYFKELKEDCLKNKKEYKDIFDKINSKKI